MFLSSNLLNGQVNCDYTLEEIYCLDYVQDFFDGIVAYSFNSTDFQNMTVSNGTDVDGNQVIYLSIFTQSNQFDQSSSWEVYDCDGNLIEDCETTSLAIWCDLGEPETTSGEIIYSANENEDITFPGCSNCEDGIQNGEETGIDCGGPDCTPCSTGCTDPEANNYDSMASQDDGTCAYCCDGEQNGTETGVDCGGPVCIPCNYTLDCNVSVSNISVTTIPFTISIETLLSVNGACNISFDRNTSTQSYDIDCSDFGTETTKLDSLLLYDIVTEDSCYIKYNITKASNLCTCGQDDYPALMDLYHAIDGDNWRFNAGWASGALGNSCMPCDWYGIECNNDNRVIAINLDTNFMEGIIPSTISQIDDLVLLDLNGNSLQGNIPEEVNQLSDLEFLVLNNNQIEGSIPLTIGSLTKLKRIVLFDNQLTGEMPTNLNNLDNLEWLMLSNNQLTGSIPSNISQMDNLLVLWLSGNELSGNIPEEITGMSNLINLFLQENNLTGEIPDNIGSLSNIDKLLLYDNNLEGCFPPSLDNLCGIGESNDPSESGYNFSGNNLLPFNGDYLRICNGEDQIGAFCGMLQDSLIDVNCVCFSNPPSAPCSMDTDSILCYGWLNDIISVSFCIDPGPTIYKVYTTSYDGSPAILVDSYTNCNDPATLGGGFTLYTCEGDQIESCTYAGFDNCNNPPDDHPILGPAFNNAILIYNSEVDVLPDCTTQRPFITTWKTDNPGTSCTSCITIPTEGGGYNYDVDWDNDGVYDEVGLSGDVTYDFGNAGVKTIAVRGDFPRIYFANQGDKDKLLNIDQWGDIEWNSMNSAFHGCSNLVSCGPDVPLLEAVDDLSNTFRSCSIFNGDVVNWNVSNITNMSFTFAGTNEFNQPIDSWDVSSVVDMNRMFGLATEFNQALNSWNVSSVTDMSLMFYNALSFNQSLVNWNVSSADKLGDMFSGAENFNFSLGDWDLHPDVNFISSFGMGMLQNSGIDCENYSNTLIGWANNPITPSNRDLGLLTDIEFGIGEAELARTYLVNDLSWTISGDTQGSCGVTELCLMDTDSILCYDWLNDIISTSFCTDPGPTVYKVYTTSYDGNPAILVDSYTNCNNPATLGGGFTLYTCEGDQIESCTYAGFDNCDNPPDDHPILGPAFTNATLIYNSEVDELPECTSQLPFITIWNTANTSTESSGPTSITIPTIGSGYSYDVDWENDGVYDDFDVTGNITHDYGVAGTYEVAIQGDFPRIYFNNEGDRSKIVEVNHWGGIEWTSMEKAFNGCDNLILTAIDIPDLSLVTDMSGMFLSATSLNQDISLWDVSNVTDMNGMFGDAINFNQDISSWKVDNVTDMSVMFAGATAFDQDISLWDVSNTTNMSLMFWDASSFNQDISPWVMSNTTNMFRMFIGAASFNKSLAPWNLMSTTNLEGMLSNSGMDCENYSSTLIGWAANNNTPDNLDLGADNLEYGADAIAARDQLITKGWTFNGDVQGSCGIPCPDDEIFNSITICPDSLSTISLDDFAGQNPNGDDIEGWLGSLSLIFGDNTFSITDAANCTYTQTVTLIEDTEDNCDTSCPDITWIDTPSDVTISYNALANVEYDLSYSNGGMDICSFTGTVVADTTITTDGCDKLILLEWSVTDNEMTIDTHQNIRITDIPIPTWIDPINDIEISCDDIPAIEDRLVYSNGLTDFCAITGTAQASITIDAAICSEDRILTWNYDGAGCFTDLTHTQMVSVVGCNDFSINDDFLSAMTQENIDFNLLDNDIALIPNVDYTISITDIGDELISDTLLNQDGLFSFRITDSFFDTIKVTYEVCDVQCIICESATFYITDEILEDITPTNYLSPNGDGQNDQLRFTREDVMDGAELWIYNRWGDQLYHKENYTNDWDANGIPSGVYYYVLQLRGVTLKRTLTILK